jgi:O-antigen ligase
MMSSTDEMSVPREESRLSQWSGFIPLLLSFIIPWPTRVFSIVTGFCLVFILVERLARRRLDLDVLKTEVFLLTGASALMLLAGLLHTPNLKEGFAELERNSMLVLFPFFIYQWRNTAVNLTQLIFAFLAGVLVLTVYGFFYMFMAMDEARLEQALQAGHSYYSDSFQLHPSYLAMFLVFGFFFLLEYLRTHRHVLKKYSLAALIALLAYMVFLIWFLRARIGIVVFGMTTIVYCLWMIRSTFKKIAVALACLTVAIIIAAAVDVEGLLKEYGRDGMLAMEDRISIWKSAWEGYKLSPFFGAGTGGAQQLIDEGYLETGYDHGLDNRHNAHNQYLQLLCRNGIPEFAAFILLCIFCYKKAITQRSFIFFSFLFISNITMITETLMNRQKGVAFFYFFVCVFAFLKHE